MRVKQLKNSIRFIKTCLERGVKTDDELYLFVRLALGIAIPRKAVCKGHQSPFTFICDLFFERVDNCLILGNRNGGKTLLIVGVLNILNMIFKPKIEICSSSAERSQAKQGYRHFRKLLNLWWVKGYVIESIQERTIFSNDSHVEIITGSESGYNSKHPNILIVDEVDLITDWSILEEAFSMSFSGHGYKAQNILLSTRKSSTGTMQKLVLECKERGFKLYSFCIFEVTEKCKLKMDCQNCSIFSKCEGLARQSQGFYPIELLKKKAKNMDNLTFSSQWACKLPPSQGSFYDFSRSTHVIDVKSFTDRYKIEYKPDMKAHELIPTDWQRFCAMDFGYSHPTVFLAFAVSPMDNTIYCYHEMYQTGLTESMIVNAWQGMIKHAGTGKMIFQKSSSFVWNNESWLFVVGDSASPSLIQAINQIRRGKIPVTRTNKHEKSKEFSYTRVRERLQIDDSGNAGLIFFDNCVNAIREHESLAYPAGKEKSEFPATNQDDHTTDCVRHGLTRYYVYEKAKKQAERNRENIKKLYA